MVDLRSIRPLRFNRVDFMNVLELAEKLKDAGVPCAIVGGAVRDYVYNRGVPKDFDIIVLSKDDANTLMDWFEYEQNTYCSESLDHTVSAGISDAGDGFAARWADWWKLDYNAGEGVIDILLPASVVLQGPEDTTLDLVTTVSAELKKFDCDMNQQAVFIRDGFVSAITLRSTCCRELRELPPERRARMKARAAECGLEYIEYDPARRVVTPSQEGSNWEQ